MAILLDTNILLRWANEKDPEYQITIEALDKLDLQHNTPYTTPQNYVEFWSVATRPVSVNGLGLPVAETLVLMKRLRALFPMLPDIAAIFDEWLNLVTVAAVSGRRVHDARLVAVMLAHGVDSILTFDTDDFARHLPFGITPVHPASV